MKIVADKNMPFALEAFSTLGDVELVPGRKISAEDCRDAELLFTRSTTKVGPALLENSRVRFYGSSVIGTDHIDIPYLEKRGIVWSPAPGCNAESVANYVTAALFLLSGKDGFTLAGKTAGVVGVGNVGKRVCRHLRALGMNVLMCDPPRQRAEGGDFVPLETILEKADIITCHVPLTKEGPDATYHMLSTKQFAAMKQGVFFINAARGPILDSDVLLGAIAAGITSRVVLDCWEGEPDIRQDLAANVDIATPHIAGHAYEGKVNGTEMVYRKACEFLQVQPTCSFALPPPPIPEWTIDAKGDESEAEEEALLRPLILAVYDIEADDRRLREEFAFDALRSHYPMRRQFYATTVHCPKASARLKNKLRGLGFVVAEV